MKLLLFVPVLLALLTGCAPQPQIQVVTLRGSNVTPSDEGLMLDNDTLTLRYNFASERGRMAISIVNKLNQPLYVDWKRSSFIIGQNKMDYWRDVADVQLSGSGSSYGTMYSRYTVGYLGGSISKEDAVGFIPPRTKLEKQQFVVIPIGSVNVRGPFEIRQEKARWIDQKKPVEVRTYIYPDDQSPVTFRNYITLSTDKDFKTEFHIDTKFWASHVDVLPRDQVLSVLKSSGGYDYSEPVAFRKADSFYVPLPVQY